MQQAERETTTCSGVVSQADTHLLQTARSSCRCWPDPAPPDTHIIFSNFISAQALAAIRQPDRRHLGVTTENGKYRALSEFQNHLIRLAAASRNRSFCGRRLKAGSKGSQAVQKIYPFILGVLKSSWTFCGQHENWQKTRKYAVRQDIDLTSFLA
jgi:hypothetical protein